MSNWQTEDRLFISTVEILQNITKMQSLQENPVKINPEKVPLETDQGILISEEKKWGIPLREVYKHGLAFYKGIVLNVFYCIRVEPNN